jgi:outer membrane receptor protein involved in Fe transport
VPVANLPDVVTEGSAGFAAADYNWALVFAYNAPVFGNDLSTALIIRATDDVFLSTNNGTPNFEKGYTLVDANVTYTWAQADGSQVVAALTGKNLTDEEYVEQELELGGGGFRGWGPPRQIALELSWRH